MANRTSGSVSVLRNDAGITFAVSSMEASVSPSGIDVGDIDSDGLLDIAVASRGADAVVLLHNVGGGNFERLNALQAPGAPGDVTLARIDADGSLDVVIADTGDPQDIAVVFLNDGAGSFTFGGGFPLHGREAVSIVDADFDGDGDDDLVAANASSDEIALLENVGGVTFAPPQLLVTGGRPVHVTVGDVDGNGAKDLVATDETGGDVTVFLNADCCHSPMRSFCHSGEAGVMVCPCANQPASSGRGCDNSAATGGARLSASGNASLADDTLVFSTDGQRTSGLSILLQGNAHVANGTMFGQGVRCVGGMQKRLYTKPAFAGAITAPSAGEPAVSVRSAELGDAIAPGEDRYYQGYYRDPVADLDCPGAGSFNATQGGRVTWGP